MKKISLYMALLGALVLTSCGTSASYSNSAYMEDGIYYMPDQASLRASISADQAQIAQLTSQTRESATYHRDVDTLVLDQSRNVNVPLELDKTYVVLLDGETYEERFNKFDNDDYSFTINFEYNIGVGYGYPYYNPYYSWRWYSPRYYTPYYAWGWYDPWYDPWYYPPYFGPYYSPYYSPYYAWGWYDPWYDPWYYYPHIYPGYYPGHPGPGHYKDVVHGRRDPHRPHTTVADRKPHNTGNRPTNNRPSDIRPTNSGDYNRPVTDNTIRKNREIKEISRPGSTSVSSSERKTVQRTGVHNNNSRASSSSSKYRQSANPTHKRSSVSSGSNRNNTNVNATYSNQERRATSSSQSNFNSRSSYSGSSSGAMRSGGGGGSSNTRSGGRR